MANKQDLVVKMTINSQDFDAGLNKAKSSMNKMQQQTITVGSVFKKTMGAMAKAAAGLGIAMGATEIAKSFIKSTQTMGDAWNNAMVTAKTSFQSLEMAVATGNQSILTNFRQSIAAAREFAEAMDRVGSAQISNQYARMKYVTPFNEAMTAYREAKSSGDTAGMASAAASMQSSLNAYSSNAENLMQSSRSAVTARLSSLTGGFINSGNLDQYLDQLYLEIVNGVFPPILNDFRNLETERRKGDYFYNKAKEEMAEKYGSGWRREADAMNTLANINDDTLKELLGILQTYDQVRNDVTSMRRQMNRAMGNNSTATATGGNTTVAAGAPAMSEAQLMEYLSRKMQNEVLAGDRAKDSIPIEIELLDEDIVEADTDALCEAVIRAREEMELLAQNTQMALTAANAMSNAFTMFGKVSGGTLGDVATALGAVIGQISSTVAALMVLTGAETIEGIAEVFSKAPPLLKVAMAATAAAGILGIIASAKSAFAGSFAEGGIVGGTSYSGDKLWARVNSGEMILNRSQTAALMNGGGQVRFVIEGSQLKGVLDNYNLIENL